MRVARKTGSTARSDSGKREASTGVRRGARSVAWYAMSPADLATTASGTVDTRDWITAGATVVAAFVIAELVNQALKRRGRQLGEAVSRGRLSPETETRLRLVRRMIFATI